MLNNKEDIISRFEFVTLLSSLFWPFKSIFIVALSKNDDRSSQTLKTSFLVLSKLLKSTTPYSINIGGSRLRKTVFKTTSDTSKTIEVLTG